MPSSPAREYKFGCVCSYMAGHEDAGVVTGHIGTNTRPNLYPLAGDDGALTIRVGLELAEENPPEKIHPKLKSSSEQVFLNNFHWVPDSCHREEGKSSRELFEKVRVNAVFLNVFGISQKNPHAHKNKIGTSTPPF